jgi:hypothetical protein
MRSNCPDVYVLPNRPSYEATGRTDSIEYAWMHWKKNIKRDFATVRILAVTPLAERRL